jgi:hypothetical protein
MKFKEQLSIAFTDRSYIIAWSLTLLALIAILVLAAVQIRPSDLQSQVRYTSFGITNFYTDKWYYELTFVAFAVFMFGFHSVASLRLYAARGRQFAVAFLWLTLATLAITGLTVFAILRVVSISQ